MLKESVLLESRTLRSGVLDRTDVLDRVKVLSLLPDGLHVTTAMVAAYFEVAETVVNNLLSRHRHELQSNGMRVLRGSELRNFKELNLSSYDRPQPRSALAIWSRRSVLNVAMLLRDSEVARQVRVYLLDMEYLARTQPVDNPVPVEPAPVEPVPIEPAPTGSVVLDDRIDRRITHILGSTVVPMLNALIATSGEHRRELLELREDIEDVERRLCWHHKRLTTLEGEAPAKSAASTLGAMTWQAFEQHVAGLLRHDGCTDVVVRQARGDRGIDVTGRTADGRTVAVRCENRSGRRTVAGADLRKFAGAARALHRFDLALFVAACDFGHESQAIADLTGVVTVDRREVEAWTAGVRLKALR
ncbi:restriction endonuclease [Streptomyces prasinopilosus]|uniref:Restriction endonuclease n=1 Tax=Streptomyces prasinopilosus TaxID=67344 RepID=A0A1G6ZAH0_9ACTN|nr:restriction endonuclease [Streptomyces prasinopilosus]SDD99303.1 Restriction endonuclease [Streptomyces prasinopilosus]